MKIISNIKKLVQIIILSILIVSSIGSIGSNRGFDDIVKRYDTNNNNLIEKSEAVQAVIDYFNGIITKQECIEVVMKYYIDQNLLPITVVSVQEITMFTPPSPAGPTIKVTLRNNASIPTINLSAMLSIISACPPELHCGTAIYDFPNISQSNPLMPGLTTSQTLIIVSAAVGLNDTYPLVIDAKLQNGQVFNYTMPVMITQG